VFGLAGAGDVKCIAVIRADVLQRDALVAIDKVEE
jgi:hypothetical protein